LLRSGSACRVLIARPPEAGGQRIRSADFYPSPASRDSKRAKIFLPSNSPPIFARVCLDELGEPGNFLGERECFLN